MPDNKPSLKAKYGDLLPFCEPAWYQGGYSPYYDDSHVAFRKKVRAFVDKEIRPFVDDWLKRPEGYPRELHQRAYELGIQGVIFPERYGGSKERHDAFHELILWDELARCGGGMAFAQLGVNSMALPPVLNAGSEELKAEVVPGIVRGEKFISLAISEPTAGSDILAIKTTAKLAADGSHYVLNGSKKWITGGHSKF